MASPSAYFSVEGLQLIPITLNLVAGVTQELDLSILQITQGLPPIQGININNEAGARPVRLVTAMQKQSASCPAYCQLWTPFFVENPSKIYFTCDATCEVKITLANLPIPPAMWSAAGVNLLRGNNDEIFPSRIGTETAYIGSAVTINVIPPVADAYWYVTGFNVSLRADWNIGAGSVTLNLRETGSGNRLWASNEVPRGAAVNVPIPLINATGIYKRAPTLGSALELFLSTPLTAGVVNVNVFYGYTRLPT